MHRLLILSAIAVAAVHTAHAQLVQIEAVGHLTKLNWVQTPNPTVSIGTIVKYSATLDLAAPPDSSGEDWAIFKLLDDEYSFGDIHVTNSSNRALYLHKGFIPSDPDGYVFGSTNLAGQPVTASTIVITAPKGTIEAFELGNVIQQLGTFYSRAYITAAENGSAYAYSAEGDIDSFTIQPIDLTAVPEPATYGLFAILGLCAVVAGRRAWLSA